jgi:hypothetical protein
MVLLQAGHVGEFVSQISGSGVGVEAAPEEVVVAETGRTGERRRAPAIPLLVCASPTLDFR